MVAVYKPPKKKPPPDARLRPPDRYRGKLPKGRYTDAQGWAYSGPGDKMTYDAFMAESTPKKPPPYVPSKAEKGLEDIGPSPLSPQKKPPTGQTQPEGPLSPVLPVKIKLGQPITPTTPISPKQKPSDRSGLFTTKEQRKGVKAPSSRRKPRTTSSAVTQEEGQTGTTTGIDYYPTLSKGGKVTAKKSKATTKKYAGGGKVTAKKSKATAKKYSGGGYVKTYAKGSGSRKART